MADFATTADVEARWRPLSDAEKDLAQTLLADASDMVRVRWPDIDSRLDAGIVQDVTLRRIVANMVRRAMMRRDVEGVSQQTDVAGPYTQSQSFANPNGNLFLSADEIAALNPNGFRPRMRNGWLA